VNSGIKISNKTCFEPYNNFVDKLYSLSTILNQIVKEVMKTG